MRSFPFFDARSRNLVVRILRSLRAHIQDNGGTKQLFRRNLVYGCFAGWEVHWSVQMRSIVLQHPETPCEISVLLDRGVYLRLEPSLISGPRHQLVVDRVTQVYDSCFPCRNPGKQVVTLRVLREKSHKGESAAGKQSHSAQNAHGTPKRK